MTPVVPTVLLGSSQGHVFALRWGLLALAGGTIAGGLRLAYATGAVGANGYHALSAVALYVVPALGFLVAAGTGYAKGALTRGMLFGLAAPVGAVLTLLVAAAVGTSQFDSDSRTWFIGAVVVGLAVGLLGWGSGRLLDILWG
ncbi:hypothetical protein C488_11193 [Natrinema pellirubrum DSM 15624]|uniref:Uncharacterized protein n=1 Tax=Natrinema pellirubrum (strain DSM 15624 / CIP 106293 / JCM 10476 / NCIMB 786 / 157) TaxID=797303 RepID=L0JLS7_NATP1|nr:hypothetical protein [Natrinema pellirubrum]AGB32234.1 hypothetical protein Natpe_2418 [Natrinema pellirubrum DSM 15624]ELY75012.1 hypothetical protein C488_11193 [Natrinema pellirubrum DSM 15624]